MPTPDAPRRDTDRVKDRVTKITFDDEKVAMRTAASRRRAELAAAMPDANQALVAHADAVLALAGGGIMAGYLPIRSELSPLPLMRALVGAGCATAMPITPPPGNPLVFCRWAPGDPLVDGPYNTRQPPDDGNPVTPGLILAPMLAFDDAARRLGYGGGFYDRTLAKIRDGGHAVTAIGIAYDEQQTDRVPTGPHDMKLDGVLTPAGLRLVEGG
jgi:5-formyltetrahydrofolate cyclo-ligase